MCVCSRKPGATAQKRRSAFLFLFAGIVFAACLMICTPAKSANAVRVLSLNVLNDDTKTARFSSIEAVIDSLQPDIFGLQECREGFSPLLARFGERGYASAVGTLTDDPLKNTIVNCVPVFYNADRFTLVSGSAGARRFTDKYQDSWTKSMCYCVLCDRETGQRLIVLNVHFAIVVSGYEGGVTDAADGVRWRRSNAAEVLLQIESMQKTYGLLPVICLGDFNMREPEAGYRMLLSKLDDCALIAEASQPRRASYHGFSDGAQFGGYPIDHIFVTPGDFAISKCRLLTGDIGKSASDHYPLYADLTVTAGSDSGAVPGMNGVRQPLIITDAARRTPYADALEGFSLLNVSDEPIDLSRILVWYGTADSEEALRESNALAVDMVMRLAEKRGEVILAPGETCFVWCISSAAYKNTVMTDDGAVYLIQKGEDGLPVYRTDLFCAAVRYLQKAGTYTCAPVEADTVILPLDRTARDAFGADGAYRNLSKSFNLQNKVYIRLYLTYDTAASASEAFCIADLDGTGSGTYGRGSDVKVHYGTFSYTPQNDVRMKTAAFYKNGFLFGNLTEVQKTQFLLPGTAARLLKMIRDGEYDAAEDRDADGRIGIKDLLRIVHACM